MSSYKALYRKYRPTNFDDVVGQEHITQTLKNEIITGRLSHAYLLMGSRGTGKTTCAKLIAKAVNCLFPNDGSPCGVCESCVGIDSGAVMDVLEIDAASNNGVDNIRELREEAVFLPANVRYRVYIIDEAHMLSVGAVNALLKIMEEPPSHVIFILATTELHKIPVTILSRCQRFDFKQIDHETLAGRLQTICNLENISVTPDALLLLAKLAQGGMRDAISLLELAYAHSEQITEDTVIEVCGLAADEYIFSIAENLLSRKPVELYNEILSASAKGVEYDRLCGQLIAHFRNLMLCMVMENPDELIVCSAKVLEQLKAQASTTDQARVLHILGDLQSCAHNISTGGMSQYELELVLSRLCDETPATAHGATQGEDVSSAVIKKLEKRINTLEARLYSIVSGNNAAENSTTAKPQATDREVAPATTKAVSRSVSDLAKNATPFEQWAEVIASLGAKNPAVKAALDGSSAFISGSYLLIDCQNPVFKQMINDNDFEVIASLGAKNPAVKAALDGSSAFISGSYLLIDCQNPVFKQMINDNDFTKKTIKNVVFDITGKMYSIAPYIGTVQSTATEAVASPLDRLISKAELGGITVNEATLDNDIF